MGSTATCSSATTAMSTIGDIMLCEVLTGGIMPGVDKTSVSLSKPICRQPTQRVQYTLWSRSTSNHYSRILWLSFRHMTRGSLGLWPWLVNHRRSFGQPTLHATNATLEQIAMFSSNPTWNQWGLETVALYWLINCILSILFYLSIYI